MDEYEKLEVELQKQYEVGQFVQGMANSNLMCCL